MEGMFNMSMTTLQFYKNPYTYPDYGAITAVGSPMPSTPVGTGLRTGSIKVKGTMADFMNCNYMAITRSGKTIYAWIDDVSFSTAESFVVDYRVDAWRTYRSEISLGQQFIERSNVVTRKFDDMLGATQAEPDVIEKTHIINDHSKRVLVVQTRVGGGGEVFSNTPVHPSLYRFYFMEYNIHSWLSNQNLHNFIRVIVEGAEPTNIVTMYSAPPFDLSDMVDSDIVIQPSNVSIPGFKMLHSSNYTQNMFYNIKEIDLGVNIDSLMRVDHSVQLVIPEAGIINITDEMLAEPTLRLRQDIDIFSGASNYMLTSPTKWFSNSVRGSSVSSIPIISDPLETYLSQNQNALATSMIGDVASIIGGVTVATSTGGLGAIAGSGAVANGLNGIISRQSAMGDLKNKSHSNPPAYLGTALANNFNQTFWTIVTKQPVDNAPMVHHNYGYPINKVNNLVFPNSGYIKTQGCNVSSDGTVPRWAIEEINQMFNNGVSVK